MKGNSILHQLKHVHPIRELISQLENRANAMRIRKAFRPKLLLSIEKGNFLVKTIENGSELDEVLRLRYTVFHREYQHKILPYGFDAEDLDLIADHLVIIDKKANKIVGTYRIISSAFSNAFYSQSEFNLEHFLKVPYARLELSRACIHRDYRKGVVMNLLWRGLIAYIQQVGAQYLFGCSSIKTVDPAEVACVSRFLTAQGLATEEFQAAPLPSYQMDLQSPKLIESTTLELTAKKLIPPLLNSYLKAGAKVAPIPAWDKEFRCVDFFTVLKLADLTRIYERKYSPC